MYAYTRTRMQTSRYSSRSHPAGSIGVFAMVRPTFSIAAIVAMLAMFATCMQMSEWRAYAAPIEEVEKTGTALVSTTFDSTTAKGMWFVEYFSPWCHHCKAFAPTWSMIVDMHEHLAQSSDFHFARVDCVAQMDLCTSHGIQGYPSILLYSDGRKVDQYSGERSYELLSTYVLTHAKAYRELQAGPGPY